MADFCVKIRKATCHIAHALFGVVLLLCAFTTTNAFATGYVCNNTTMYTSCNPGYYMTKNGSYNGTPQAGNACTICPAGYKCSGGTQAASSCSGALEYQNETGKSTCKTVSAGYYKLSNSAQSACPTGFGEGPAASTPGGCSRYVTLDKNGFSGTLLVASGTGCEVVATANGTNNGSLRLYYNTECTLPTISNFTQTGYSASGSWSTSPNVGANATSYITTSQLSSVGTLYVRKISCSSGYYKSNTTTCTGCPSGYPNSDGGTGGVTQCYSGTKSRAWSGSQTNPTQPSSWYSRSLTDCSIGACDYVAYSNSSGNGDGTVKSGCSTNNSSCTRTQTATACNSSYYLNSGDCSGCPSGWPNSSSGNTGGVTVCYKNVTKTCNKSNGSVPTNCSTVTSWNDCSCTGGTYKQYVNSSGNGDGTAESHSDESCTRTPAGVTANSNYYVSGTASCTACPSGYTISASGNSGGITVCYKNVTRGCTQNNGSVPTNCKAVTTWNACSCTGTTYKQYVNSAGTGDGTTEGTTTNETCTKTVGAVTAASGNYVSGTATCAACPTGYPNSADGNSGGVTQCYSGTKSRAWTGSQTACSNPNSTACATYTCGTCSNPACDYVAYANSAGTGDGTIKSGCSTNNAACQKPVASVTANAGYYVNGTTCSACGGNNYYCPGGTTARKTVDSGYYSTGGTETTRTGESQCTGSTYCVSGVQNNCPSADSGWTLGTGTGWTARTQCYEYKTPDNCSSGSVKRNGDSSSNAYASAITLNSTLKANANYYTTTSATSCTACPSAYPNSAANTNSGSGACYKSCSAGYYWNGTNQACAACTAGNWCAGTTAYNSTASNQGLSSCSSNLGTGYTSAGGTGDTANTKCYLTLSGKVRSGTSGTTTTDCGAGYYKGSHNEYYGTSYSCDSCTGRTKYSSAASNTSCSDVSSGYYTTGCTSNNNCTGQSACGGNNYYCSGGVQNTVTSGYYSTGGDANTRTGQSACEAGYYCSSGVRNECGGATYSTGSATSCSSINTGYFSSGGGKSATPSSSDCLSGKSCGQCPSGYRNIAASSQNGCVGTFSKSGSQTNPDQPSSWYSRSLTDCTPGSCNYTKNYAGTTVSDCTPTNCTRTQTATACNSSYYLNSGDCSACSGLASGFYPNSANGNSSGSGACYTNSISGQYVAKNATSATNCGSADKYKGSHTVNYGSSSSCSTVDSGYYTTGGTTATRTGQSACEAGYYCSSGVRNECGGATYSTGSATSCASINTGYFSSGGGKSATPSSSDCLSGKSCGQCPSGYRNIAASSQNGCVGTFSKSGSQTNPTQPSSWYSRSLTDCTPGSCNYTKNYGGSIVSDCTPTNCERTQTATACNSGYYLSSGSCPACSGLASGFYPNSANGNSSGSDACYTNSISGQYVAKNASSATNCGSADKYKGSHTVNYGGSSSCDTVTAGYYTTGGTTATRTGQSACGGNQYYCSGGVRNDVSSGYYSTGGTSTTRTGQTQCEAGNYCSGGVKSECPSATTYKRTTFPSDYYSPTITSTSVSSGTGLTAATQCYVLTWMDSTRGKLYEYTYYNSSSGKYDGTRISYGWHQVNAGYYLTDKAGCGAYAYYATVDVCPQGSYCPGKSTVTCNSSNQSTVHTTTFGLNSCSSLGGGLYTNSAAGSDEATDCYISIAEKKYLASKDSTSVSDCPAGYYCTGGNFNYSSNATTQGLQYCAGRTKYSAAKSTSCSTVDSGYYTTGCNSSGDVCTGQSQCSGSTYCVSGIQNNCPSADSGWTLGEGTGWTARTSCYEYQTPSNCSSGSVKRNGNSDANSYSSTITLNSTLKANAGYYTTTSATSCTVCPTAYPSSAANTNSGQSACYKACSAGYYWNGTNQACAACTAGNWCSATTNYYTTTTNQGLNACSTLGTGYTSDGGTGDKANTNCYLTLEGKVRSGTSGTTTTNCNSGSYKASHNEYYGTSYSCDTCSAGTYSTTSGAITACTACSGTTQYQNETGKTSCKNVDAGYYKSSNSAQAQCPANYQSGAGAATQAGCTASCSAGYAVQSTNGACTVVTTDNKYTANHTVTYGNTSTLSTCNTTNGYTNSGTTYDKHANKSSCKTTCAAGKQVASANAACSTPSGSWYTSQHTVSEGSTSGSNVQSCLTNYATPNTTTQSNHDASTDCTITCSAGSRITTANNTSCTAITSGNVYMLEHTVAQGSASAAATDCPTGYTISGSTQADHNEKSDCKITCNAGNAVLTADATCSSIQNSTYKGKYIGQNTVSAGSTSSISDCPTNYKAANGTTAQGNCETACSAGTQVATQNNACSTPTGNNWYTAAHNVKYGNTSGSNVKSCKTGYTTANTGTATDHDAQGDCKISCGAGYYIPTAGGGCVACAGGKYCSGASNIAETATSAVTGNITAGYFCAGGAKTATPSSSSDSVTSASCGKCTTDSTTGRPAYTSSSGGATSCSVCPAVTSSLSSRFAGSYGYYPDTHNAGINGCHGEFTDNDSDATYRLTCYYSSTDGTYGGSHATCHAYHPTACVAGKYDTIESNTEWQSWGATSHIGMDTMNGKVCTDTDAGYYSPANDLTQTQCPTGYPNSASGSDAITDCYSNSKSRAWTGSAVNGTTPTGCTVTAWNSCSNSACDYVAYANAAGTGDGTIKSGCPTNNANCTKTVKTVSANNGYYAASTATSCTACPAAETSSGYAYVSGTGWNTYSDCKETKSASSVSTNCYSGALTKTASSANAWGTAVSTLTAKAGYKTSGSGNDATCSACGDGYYSSNGNDGTCDACTTTSGWTTATGTTTASAYTSCYQTQTPANCASGTIKRTASSISSGTITYGSASVTSALSSNGGYYVNGAACSQCAAGTYYGGGTATSCNSCSTDTSSKYTSSAAGADKIGKCYLTLTAGKQVATAGAGASNCAENSYCTSTGNIYYNSDGGTTTYTGTTCSSGTSSKYTKSAAGADKIGKCYLTLTAGQKVATAGAGAANCDAGKYCTSTGNIYYNSDGGTAAYTGTACATGSYSSAGSSTCTACPAGKTTSGTGTAFSTSADNTCSTACTAIANRSTWGTQTWSASNNSVTGLCSVGTCVAGAYKSGNTCPVCGDNTWSNAGASSCSSCATDKSYGNSGTAASAHAGSASCTVTCSAGNYVATENGACVGVGDGYYRATSETVAYGSTGTRNACSALSGVSVSGGSYGSTGSRNASSTCTYTAPTPTKPANCATKTSNTVTYSGTAWPTSTYAVTANAGSIIVDNNTADATCEQCNGANYSAGGSAASCTNCPSQTSGWTRGTGTGWSSYSSCYETQKPAHCESGSVKHTAKNASEWNTAVSLVSTLTASNGYYASSSATSCSACPSVTSGYSYVSGTGWTAITQCKETKPYSSVSTNCYSGALTKTANSGGTWDTAVSTLTAKAGYKTSGSGDSATCSACGDGYYSANSNDGTCDACTTTSGWATHTTSNTAGTYEACYQTRTPANCASGNTKRTASSISSGTITYGSESVENTLSSSANYYVNGTTCTGCPSGYPNSAGGAGGVTQCYSNDKSRAWTGSQVNGATPTGCTVTSWNTCSNPACTYTAYANSTGNGDGTIKTGCSTNSENCTKTVATVSANNGYYAASNATSCTACPTLTDGYSFISGTGWNTYSDCVSTKSVSACASGALTRTADSASTWAAPVSTLSAGSNKYVTGSGDATTCTGCPSGYPNSAGGTGGVTQCYSNDKSRAWTGSQTECTNPDTTGCSGFTCGTCSGNACTYTAYANSTGDGDGTVKTGCSTNNAACQKPVASLTAKANYYVNGTTSCPTCTSKNSSYPKSDGGDIGYGKCYVEVVRGCTKNNGSTPSNCSVTAYNDCSCTGDTYKSYADSTTSGTTTNETCIKTVASVSANAGYYVDGLTCPICTGVGGGLYPNSNAGNTGGASACYTDEISGKYVAANATVATNCAAGSFKGAHQVNYGSSSSCSVCDSNKYSDAGSSSCTACATANGYGNSGSTANDHAGVTSCTVSCPGGSYVATSGGACVDVTAGYYKAAHIVAQTQTSTRGQCATGLTTIGYGAGADEAGDCGRVLHTGTGELYLRSDKKTEPSLNVKIGNTTYYGNMSTSDKVMSDGQTEKLKVKDNGTTYSVHDDSVN